MDDPLVICYQCRLCCCDHCSKHGLIVSFRCLTCLISLSIDSVLEFLTLKNCSRKNKNWKTLNLKLLAALSEFLLISFSQSNVSLLGWEEKAQFLQYWWSAWRPCAFKNLLGWYQNCERNLFYENMLSANVGSSRNTVIPRSMLWKNLKINVTNMI